MKRTAVAAETAHVPDDPTRHIKPRPLLVMAAAVTLLGATGVLPRWPGLLHLVALPPFDLMADLRLLLVSAPSYPAFIAGSLASVALRTSVLALLLGGLDRRRVQLAGGFYLIAYLPCLTVASLFYASAAMVFYLLFWGGVAFAALLLAPLASLPWLAADLRLPTALAAWLRRGLRYNPGLAYLGLLTLLGAMADIAGPIGAVLLVPASAALTLVTAALFMPERRWAVVTRTALAGGTALLMGAVGFLILWGPFDPVPVQPNTETTQPGSLFLMSGIDSQSGVGLIFEVDPRLLGFACADTYYFSYAGPGEGQPQNKAPCPVKTGAPYGKADTLRPADEVIEGFRRQVEQLPPPVTVLAHSQGAWIALAGLADGETHGVGTLILVGTLATNPIAYPTENEKRPGRVGLDVLRLMAAAARPTGVTAFYPTAPMARAFQADPAAVDQAMATVARLPQGARVLSMPSFFDLPLMPTGWRVDGAVNACPVPVIHSYLPYSGEMVEAIKAFLEGEARASACPAWRTASGPLVRPFGVPPDHAWTVGLWDE